MEIYRMDYTFDKDARAWKLKKELKYSENKTLYNKKPSSVIYWLKILKCQNSKLKISCDVMPKNLNEMSVIIILQGQLWI